MSGRGHAALIRENYGLGWAWVSLGTMLVTNFAALVTEFIGVAGAALIFGLSPALLVIVAATLLIGVAFSGRYKRAEYFALALCLLELLFIPAAFAAHPSLASIFHDGILGSQPLGDRDYLMLVAGNIGAVIMPWMIFYQQSATVDKGLQPRRHRLARADTAIGAVFTQVDHDRDRRHDGARRCSSTHQQVDDAAQAALALVPLTGAHWAGVAFGAGLLGAAMIGALVVSLATAWAFGEAFRWPCSLNFTLHARRSGSTDCMPAMVVVVGGRRPHPESAADQDHACTSRRSTRSCCRSCSAFLLVMANDRKILGDRGELVARQRRRDRGLGRVRRARRVGRRS